MLETLLNREFVVYHFSLDQFAFLKGYNLTLKKVKGYCTGDLNGFHQL